MVFGEGKLAELGTLCRSLGSARPLIVTDPGIRDAGILDSAQRGLAAAGLTAEVFADTRENPDTDDVRACLAALQQAQPDLLIGLGGGSAIDLGKGANLVHAGGGELADYWGSGKAKGTLLPMIAVPTTAGTGSEMQSFTLIADAESHQKMACGDPQLTPRIALLDPTLTLSMPATVTAHTGVDTLGHALEAAVTLARNPISSLFAETALQLCLAHLPRVMQDPGDLPSRGAMLKAAAFAGLAIEQSMLGAAHSLANPLTAHHGLAHGLAVGMNLVAVMRFNSRDPEIAAIYAGLAEQAGLPASTQALVDRVTEVLATCAFPADLQACGLREADLPALAEEGARQWTAQFNPVPVTATELLEILQLSLRA